MKRIQALIILFTFCFLQGTAQEICNNAQDDDNDGLVDLNDTTDCACTGADAELLSLIPNPSFEEFDCIPFGVSELNCAAGWSQATDATSDYFRLDGFWPDIIPEPVPEGDAVAGFLITINTSFPGIPAEDYLEYIGACLNAPMLAGQSYTLQMSLAGTSWNGTVSNGVYYGPVDIVLYGSPNCPTWPIGSGLQDCPLELPNWSILGSVNYTADETWQTVTITFTPTEDIQAVMIGGPCDVPPDYAIDPNDFDAMMPYFLIDNLVLDNSANFSLLVNQSGGLCTDDLVFAATADSTSLSLQWFEEGVALLGQQSDTLLLSALGLDDGTYQVASYLPNEGCTQLNIDAVRVLPELPTLEVASAEGCAPLQVQFTTSDGIGQDSCVWNFGDGASAPVCDANHLYTSPGTYDVVYSVINSQGCRRDTTLADAAVVYAVPEVMFDVSENEWCVPFTATINALSTSGTDYDWYFVNDNQTISTDLPTVNYLFTDSAEVEGFEIIVMANQFDFCADTDTLRVFPITCGDPIIEYPNVFTPNGDGENDSFFLTLKFVKSLHLKVFNRWGTLVFEKSTSDAKHNNVRWSGEISGQPAAEGVYYFTFEATGLEGQRIDGSSYVHLISQK